MTWLKIFLSCLFFCASVKMAWRIGKWIVNREVQIYWLKRYNDFLAIVIDMDDCQYKHELIAEIATIEILKKAKLPYVDIIRRRLKPTSGKDPRHPRPSTAPHIRG